MDELRNIITSEALQAVIEAVDALDPALLLDPTIGAHLIALRTGAHGLAAVVLVETVSAPPEPIEPQL